MKSIRARLLAPLLLGLSLTLAAGGSAVYLMARHSLLQQLDAGLETRARLLSAAVSREPRGLVLDPESIWPQAVAEAHFEFLAPNGRLLHAGGANSTVVAPPLPPSPDACAFADATFGDETPGRAVWLLFSPHTDADLDDAAETPNPSELLLADSASVPSEIVVAVVVSRQAVDGALASLLAALTIVGGALVLIMAGVVALGVRWGLHPLRRLRSQLGGISGERLATRLEEPHAVRELRPVYDELNRMLERVQGTLERERTFASAAAHELRTPLAELRSTTEVAMRWPDPASANAALEQALEIGGEMETLIESLLRISRSHAGPNSVNVDHVSVEPLVRECLAEAQPRIQMKSLLICSDVPEGVEFAAPRDALEIIIRNLVENAVGYTPQNGKVSISARNGTPSGTWLAIENEPVDLGSNQVPRLFEPFWRLDPSRADRTHAGLGLTVVRQVALAVGLQVQASLDGQRLRMRISPAAAMPD